MASVYIRIHFGEIPFALVWIQLIFCFSE